MLHICGPRMTDGWQAPVQDNSIEGAAKVVHIGKMSTQYSQAPEKRHPRDSRTCRDVAGSADPVAQERALGADHVLLKELCALLLAKRCNAIELSNLAFILGHRHPRAAPALKEVEAYGKGLLHSRTPVHETQRSSALDSLQHAAAVIGLKDIFSQHCGGA